MRRAKSRTEKYSSRSGKAVAEESRSSRRIQKRFILRAAVFGETPLRWSYVTIHNISSSGAFFIFDKVVKVGALLHFKIDFPDRVVECMGRVRRLIARREKQFQDVAASFEGIKTDDREYIDAIVSLNATA